MRRLSADNVTVMLVSIRQNGNPSHNNNNNNKINNNDNNNDTNKKDNNNSNTDRSKNNCADINNLEKNNKKGDSIKSP